MALLPDHLRPSLRDRRRHQMDADRRKALILSYLPDWLLTIVLWIVFYLIDNAHGYFREFDLTDGSIQHTYAVHERVPVWALAIIGAIAPLVIMAAISLGLIGSFWDFHNAVLGLVLSLALSTTVTDTIKITVGRPRPDLIDRCQPMAGAANASPYGLATSAICTQTDFHTLRDGFRSFPSGHSSFAFAGLGFLALYLGGKLHISDRQGFTAKTWICVVPLLAAALVAVSRTMDYRHHSTDVIAGAILGYITAWVSYRQYYPAIYSQDCHKPYSPRLLEDMSSLVTEPNGHDAQFHVLPLHSTSSQDENASVHPAQK
ncbi:uncharacterized protein L969DRAFT_103395 [Mixia osmundae IAM 14324]|uniref:Phosphatidic acid phosphatase type 2/haloperoxidase domain-containing protein n=1 Tax=Mixia osmundae (strain CBS 9802 / IAM 14324 / JCM 22182 / KY 12970) TaxID=764103 RepID=G7E0T9_MIXOS|nr:uncharacterized protein L969DRAFT_103395 [Mixia osmundae IAM 14324]KEI39478.1 hypothetical protein L969DRAFT_103395 [Mixia osmundae IAM 14324]GAA96449.1 hypothetical protein E5Q_03116 [Mixia osmundae IAM 14324]